MIGRRPGICCKMQASGVLLPDTLDWKSKEKEQTYLKQFRDTLLAFVVQSLNVIWDCCTRRQTEVWSSSCEQITKLLVVDDIGRPIVFGYPFNNVSTDDRESACESVWYWLKTHWTSGFIWDRCEYWTSCCPCRAKAANMDPLQASGLPSAILTASSPKHRSAWYRRLAVEDLSLESW